MAKLANPFDLHLLFTWTKGDYRPQAKSPTNFNSAAKLKLSEAETCTKKY